MYGLLGLLVWVLSAIIGAVIGPMKERTRPEGFFGCLMFGPVGLLTIALEADEDATSYPMRFHEELRFSVPPRGGW